MQANSSFPDFTPAANSFAGKVILVTGAGRGIGRAMALAFAKYGATLVLLGRTEQPLADVYDQIEREGGAQPALLPGFARVPTWKRSFKV